MANWNFEIDRLHITAARPVFCVSDSENYIRAHFTFAGDMWGRGKITAIFKRFKDDGGYSVILDDDGTCLVPAEVLLGEGNVSVGVMTSYTDEEDKIVTVYSDKCSIYALPSCKVDELLNPSITPGQYEQIMALIGQQGEVEYVTRDEFDVLFPYKLDDAVREAFWGWGLDTLSRDYELKSASLSTALGDISSLLRDIQRTIHTVRVNGTAQTVTDGAVDISVPTSVSQLSNDAQYVNLVMLNQALSNKVNTVAGKGLSSNDYTNEDKASLADLLTRMAAVETAISGAAGTLDTINGEVI